MQKTRASVDSTESTVLLTGASGYVGGRLLGTLERRGMKVRCLARRPDFLRPRVSSSTEVVQGDVLDVDSLRSAMAGVKVAYYLVHSMGSEGDFESEDLRESGIPTIEFRASIIIGSGSLSFEIIRALVEKLPVMVTPLWVSMRAQPLAIEDLIDYLVAAIDVSVAGSHVFEIGGSDSVSYLDIMKEYARQRGLRRFMIRVPVLTPRLSSLWLGLVTPVYARVGRQLVDSIRNPTVVEDNSAMEFFDIRPRGIREAVAQAITNENREFAETRWSDSSSSGVAPRWGGMLFGSRIVDSRSTFVSARSREAFHPIQRIGEYAGWYYASWLWRLRGFIDTLAGGVGSRRGRRSPDRLVPGDTVDFWRVEAIVTNELLRLRAEMKLPGRAWLQFEVVDGESGSTIRQTAIFDPVGVLGLLYWYGLYPLHKLVFAGMLRGIVSSIEGPSQEDRTGKTGRRHPHAHTEVAGWHEAPVPSIARQLRPSDRRG
jgi:uncharacterized protein YbjT (DUF2867 family)